MYSEVLRTKLDAVENFVMAKRPRRVPVVLTRGEVSALLTALSGVPQLMASLLYGSGLRLLECVTLRVKDLDFARRQVVVRRGKGANDRVTVLPEVVAESLKTHLVEVRQQHESDLARGAGCVVSVTAT